MPSDILDTLCHDLRRLREQAGGPSLRELARHIGLGKSQVCAILNGNIRRPPDWRVVRGLVEICYRHARERGRWPHLSINAGLDEYWRLRFALVEHAAGGSGIAATPVSRLGPRAGPAGRPGGGRRHRVWR